MSKYSQRFFVSPYSNISPPATSFEMARSDSRDSTSSSSSRHHYSTTPAYTSSPVSMTMSRTSSSSSPRSEPMRRSSSSSSSYSSKWIASPYRSCLTTSYENQPSSYLSDDDLECLSLPVESIPSLTSGSNRHKEMTTEEQIAYLRERQAREEALERNTKKQVRFEAPSSKSRRPSQVKSRRSTVSRRFNGPC